MAVDCHVCGRGTYANEFDHVLRCVGCDRPVNICSACAPLPGSEPYVREKNRKLFAKGLPPWQR